MEWTIFDFNNEDHHGVPCGQFNLRQYNIRRSQWHPTPVLLPRKSMDEGAWQAAVHWVAKSRTRLSNFTFTFHFHVLEKEMETHSSILAWRIPGTGSLVGCHLWGCTELDKTEATQQQQQYNIKTLCFNYLNVYFIYFILYNHLKISLLI